MIKNRILLACLLFFISCSTAYSQKSYSWKGQYGIETMELNPEYVAKVAPKGLQGGVSTTPPERRLLPAKQGDISLSDSSITPVFKSQTGGNHTLPGGVFVYFNKKLEATRVRAFLENNNYNDRATRLFENEHIYRIDSDHGFPAAELAQELSKFDEVDFVEVDKTTAVSKR